MKTKINLIVTVNSDGLEDSNDLAEQLKTVESFCRIKNQHGCQVNERILTFEVNKDKVFAVIDEK